MNRFISFLSLIFIFSCNLHKQENVTAGKKESRVVNQSVIAQLSNGIVINDVLSIKKLLAEGNFELNVFDKDGELLLNKAIRSNAFVIAKLLMENDADPAAQDERGQSAFELVEASTYKADWQALLKGEKLTAETSTALIFQAINEGNGSNEAVKLDLIANYLALGAPIDGKDSNKFSYLIIASSKGLVKIITYLCSNPDTDPNYSVVKGRGSRKKTFTALSEAKGPEVKDALIECGAKN